MWYVMETVNMKLETKYIRILLRFANDTVGIMSFVTESPRDGWTREPTDDAILYEIKKSSSSYALEQLPVLAWMKIDESDIPTDRTFRNAWKRGTVNHIEVDMPRARNIHRDNLRERRTYLLAALDEQYLRADESNDKAKKTDIANQKQKLRDVTSHPLIEAAMTPEALKALSIEILTQ
jgi:hypothetical protein